MNSLTSVKHSKKILNERVVSFFSGKRELNSLSNFWACKIIIHCDDGVERRYESGEHCFHGEKYYRLGEVCLDESRRNKLILHSTLFLENSGKTAAEVKRLGGKRGLLLNDDELIFWTSISPEVQRIICDYKIKNYEQVRNDLIMSGDRILVHPAMRCSVEKVKTRFWEGRAVVLENDQIEILGGNMLGNLWMNARMLKFGD